MHGKTESERDYLLNSAKEVEKAGAFSVVLECIETTTAETITKSIAIPTIGIGSGTVCDGQVLVFHDLVGLTLGHVPKFVEPTANLKEIIQTAVKTYVDRVKNNGVKQ
jgi:3-methyl-2-oxobutanoate hydroxymethyltransferase